MITHNYVEIICAANDEWKNNEWKTEEIVASLQLNTNAEVKFCFS